MKKHLLCILLTLFTFALFANDGDIAVIKSYYRFLEEKKLEEAYAISTKKVSFAKFSSWYSNVFKAKADNFTKNADGSYTFTVWYSEYYDYLHNDNKVYYFEVTMQVDGGRIVSSKSKSVSWITEKKLVYNKRNSTIEIVDDFEANMKRLYLVGRDQKRVELDTFPYDHLGLSIGAAHVEGDLLVLQMAGFEGSVTKMYNLISRTPYSLQYGDVYISPGGVYVFSYMAGGGMFEGGVQLESAQGRRISKNVLGDPGAYEVKVVTEKGRDYLHIKTGYDAPDFSEVIDLTALLETL